MAATPLPALRGAAKSRRFCSTLKDLPSGFNGAAHARVSHTANVNNGKLSGKYIVCKSWLAVTKADNRSGSRPVESAREEELDVLEAAQLLAAQTICQKNGG